MLGDLIDSVLDKDETDSPVYTFLNNLIPPSLKEQAEQMFYLGINFNSYIKLIIICRRWVKFFKQKSNVAKIQISQINENILTENELLRRFYLGKSHAYLLRNLMFDKIFIN